MITITSILHRAEFTDLIERWMYDQPQPDDGALLSRLVHFNNVFISRYLKDFAKRLLAAIHGREPRCHSLVLKGQLKDLIVQNPPHRDERVEQLIADYHAHPGRYYRQTPFQATAYLLPDEKSGEVYVGSSRIKRARRLAEKCARRIIDNVFAAIKTHADELAEERARLLGIPREQLHSSPAQMLVELTRAEERIMNLFKSGRPFRFAGVNSINDVAGIKVILEDDFQPRLLDWLESQPDCRVLEQEHHQGRYNATNLTVAYRPDKQRLLGQKLGPATRRHLEACCSDASRAEAAFSDFVLQGEEEVIVEIIVSNYREMLESEIGICMHEDRILEQRRQQQYRRPLAKNIEYLMVYMFNFAVSPRRTLQHLPIKLWNRYLPDTIDELIRALFDLPPLALVE